MLRTLLPWLLVLSANAAPTVNLKSLLTKNENSWSAGTTLSFPGTSEFGDSTMRWSITEAPTYSAGITPATERDIQTIVRLATSNNIPFLATGGRHGYTQTLGALKNGLAIDLSKLNSYKIDRTAGTITVGGSTTIGDMMDAIYQAGFWLQSGSGSCPGYVGLTVGAGVGRYMGIFGLVTDSLISARLVTSGGKVVDVSAKQNPDLFWAIRGAGANFGVITSATYKLHRMKDYNNGQLLSVDVVFPASKSREYFNYVQSFSERLPANVAGITLINYSGNVNDTAQVQANWIYIGPEKDGRKFFEPLLALKPAFSNQAYIPWNKLISTAGGGFDAALCGRGRYHDFYAINLRKYSAATYQQTFEKMAKLYKDNPEATPSYVMLETFPNQATMSVPNDATAYPWRDATGFILGGVEITDKATAATKATGAKLMHELRDSWVKTSGYPELSMYINYAHGDEKIWQIYGRDKLPRLAALKKKWDPKNAFSFNNGLPSKYPN